MPNVKLSPDSLGKERLNVNLDRSMKAEAASVLSDIGMDFTTAITIYFKQIIDQRKIPFEVSAPRYYSTEEVFGQDWREVAAGVEDEWE